MTRNPNYVNPTTAGPAHLEALTFRWYPDRAALIAGYRAGDVDVTSGLDEDDLPKLTKLDGQVASRPSMRYEALRPNWSADTCSRNNAVKIRGPGCPMADPAVRMAVAAAIDRSALADLIPGSTGLAPATNVNPQAWFYAKQAGQAFSPAAARKILDESGWKDADHDGVREKDGLQARIEVCTTARQSRLDGTALVAAWLKDVGIATTTRVADPADMFATYDRATAFTPCALEQGNFDLAMQSMPSSIDPGSYYLTYHSSQFEPDGQNDAHVDDVGIDVALETVKATANATVIVDAMVEFQKIYAEQTVEIPIHFSQTVDLHAAAIGNFVGSSPAGGPTWNVADWFIKG
jgi:peptide/nickel transport system substrate-binding protein